MRLPQFNGQTPGHKRAAAALSYGLAVGLIAVVALSAISSSGGSVETLFGDVADNLESAGAGSSPVAASPTPTPSPTPDAVACGSVSFATEPGKCVYTFTGTTEFFEVPEGISTVTVKAWGAGGGGPFFSDGVNDCNHAAFGCADGGGGGFASLSISVTPAETLTVVVGEGGLGNTSFSPGGGYSGLFRGGASQGNALVIAGGGGGAGLGIGADGGPGGGALSDPNGRDAPSLIISGNGYSGGSGGNNSTMTGAAGIAVYSSTTPSNCASDFGVPTAGTALQGGDGEGQNLVAAGGFGGGGSSNDICAAGGGAGGGGGYIGGGGGSDGFEGGCCTGGGGGGGSSFAPGGTLDGTTNGRGPVRSGDADYVSGVGVGGDTGQSGGHGLLVISW